MIEQHAIKDEIILSIAAGKYHSKELLENPYQGDQVDITIFISCYNEAGHIIKTIDEVSAALKTVRMTFEILIIDDASSDNSWPQLMAYTESHPEENIIIKRNHKNKGLAQNYLNSVYIGKGKYHRLVCGDNAEPQESLVKLFKEIGQADVIIPYYYRVIDKGFGRMVISKTYTALINLITGYRLHYYNGLQIHLRYNVMRWHSNTRGFGFQAETLTMILDKGFTYKEVPILGMDKKGADSRALTFRNMLSVVHTLLEIFLRRMSNRLYR